MDLCFATNNAHKLTEIQTLLGDNFRLLSLADIGCTEEIPEPFDTITDNSAAKARYIRDNYGRANFADDTGLEVYSLNNEPGVYSARYAGPHRNSDDNIALILQKLEGAANRKARFLTVITLVMDNQERQFEGIVEGTIIHEKRGSNGFGYDPVFVPDGYSKTFAEMTLEEKSKISHRARAFEKLIAFLQNRD